MHLQWFSDSPSTPKNQSERGLTNASQPVQTGDGHAAFLDGAQQFFQFGDAPSEIAWGWRKLVQAQSKRRGVVGDRHLADVDITAA